MPVKPRKGGIFVAANMPPLAGLVDGVSGYKHAALRGL